MIKVKKSIFSKGRGGFTLIETLMSLLIIAIGFMATVVMQTGALRSGTMTSNQTIAVILADMRLEELRSVDADTLNDGKLPVEYFDRLGESVPTLTGSYFSRETYFWHQRPTQHNNEVQVTVKEINGKINISYTSILPGAAIN